MNKYAKRLLKLAGFLENLPRKRFSFNMWSNWKYVVDGNVPLYEPTPKSFDSCGTKACALGWACMMPSFRRLGLKLNYLGQVDFVKDDLYIDGAANIGQHIFDLEYLEFQHLFVPGGGTNGLSEKATPKQVAANIRQFVADKYQ